MVSLCTLVSRDTVIPSPIYGISFKRNGIRRLATSKFVHAIASATLSPSLDMTDCAARLDIAIAWCPVVVILFDVANLNEFIFDTTLSELFAARKLWEASYFSTYVVSIVVTFLFVAS